MAFRIDDFVSNLPGGGARGNLFEVTISPPLGLLDQFFRTRKFQFLCSVSSLPGATIGLTPISYFGRNVNMAGDRTFEDWTTTIINDEDFAIRRALEVWQDAIQGNASNTESILRTIGGYKGTATVKQFSRHGHAVREYKMINCWPHTLAEVALDWAGNDAVETFDVTWTYTHWISEDISNSFTSIVTKTANLVSDIRNIGRG